MKTEKTELDIRGDIYRDNKIENLQTIIDKYQEIKKAMEAEIIHLNKENNRIRDNKNYWRREFEAQVKDTEFMINKNKQLKEKIEEIKKAYNLY